MNAHRHNFGSKEHYELAKKAEETEVESLIEWWNKSLVEQLGEYLPPEREDAVCMETPLEFAITLGRSIKIAAQNGLRSRQTLIAEPLLSVVYADKQQMITVTGIILEESKRLEFHERTSWVSWPYPPGDKWDSFLELAVPHMSIRERNQIHDLLGKEASPDFVKDVVFRLDGQDDTHNKLVEQYVLHHRRYPTFAPVDNM